MNCFSGWKDLAPDASTFEDQAARGPAANHGYDPIGEGDRQPHEAWLLLRPGENPKQYTRRGEYWSPSRPPVEFKYETLVNPVMINGAEEEVIRAPLKWSRDHHGVGFAGELYWLRSGGLYAHQVSYGIDSPIYPPGFIQCAIYSTRMKPLVFSPRVQCYFTRGEILVYLSAPAAGGAGFIALSHPDGVNEFAEACVTRASSGEYHIRYQSVEMTLPVGVSASGWVTVEEEDPRRPIVPASKLAFLLSLLLWLAPVVLLVAVVVAVVLVN